MQNYCDEQGKGKSCCFSLGPLQEGAWKPWGLHLCSAPGPATLCLAALDVLFRAGNLTDSDSLLGESREQFSELSCKLQHSWLPAVKGAIQVSHSLYFFQTVSWVDGTEHIWLCCRISTQLFTTKYFDSFKQTLTVINFQVKSLLSTYHFILKWKAIFLRISEVSLKWKYFC